MMAHSLPKREFLLAQPNRGSWFVKKHQVILLDDVGFLKEGYPQIMHFNGIFPHKSSILGHPNFRKPPCWMMDARRTMAKHHPDLIMCRKQCGIAMGAMAQFHPAPQSIVGECHGTPMTDVNGGVEDPFLV